MDGLTLLSRARAAGLVIFFESGRLIIDGPESAEALAQEILDHKVEILAALQAEDASPQHAAAIPSTPILDADIVGLVARLGGSGLRLCWVAVRADGSLLYSYRTNQGGPPLLPPDLPAIALREAPCWTCQGASFWIPASLTRAICRRCHPPAVERLVMVTLDVAGGQVEDTGARPQVPLRPGLAGDPSRTRWPVPT
jgi:hypothetical protein